jgi:hypothetical protein
MLLLHQTGSVKVGEVVRYTVTYTPAHDRILPAPSHLHLKIKNASAIPLRAAFVHGPYTLYVSASPSAFHPNTKANPRRDGIPEFEPNLKAGGTWSSRLTVPEDVRATAGSAQSHSQSRRSWEEEEALSVTWIIEVASQVIFSTSAAVHFEVLLGRDERSLNLGFGVGGKANPAGAPGALSEHQSDRESCCGLSCGHGHGHEHGHGHGHTHYHGTQMKGVFSRAVRLRVEDTAMLWDNPKLPEWDDDGRHRPRTPAITTEVPESKISSPGSGNGEGQGKPASLKKDSHGQRKQKKVHLVVLTHGLHSNLGADMLYLKESIDEAAKQAKQDAKLRREKRHEEERKRAADANRPLDDQLQDDRQTESGETKAPTEQREDNTDEVEDDEEIIVRGFSGNAVRTEKGIKYLGKRVAKYVLAMTYPDQPFRSVQTSATHSVMSAISRDSSKDEDEYGTQVHNHSSIRDEPYTDDKLAYRITSISFIAHSLGGLVQTYAVAYIQKHSPEFFDKIKPVNFIALASPFLGLSNENPLYVKFALDFGLVGRTGQDLGLTWRAPTIARSGWGAVVSGFGDSAKEKVERPRDPGSKPLLRILPTGPAHVALKKFRNRTVYSNVVNDGIVPLRTSCLLFLDWQGLGRVEKARRENGLVGTMAGWGWAELTGANATDALRREWVDNDAEEEADDTGANTPTRQGHGEEVPQPPPDATDDDVRSLHSLKKSRQDPIVKRDSALSTAALLSNDTPQSTGPFDTLLALFRPKSPAPKPKPSKIYKRSQTVNFRDTSSNSTTNNAPEPQNDGSAPPKTTFLEAAGDLLSPPLPPISFIIDPSSRPRTIFHDRVYHPSDIPLPPTKRRPSSSLLTRRLSNTNVNVSSEGNRSRATTSSSTESWPTTDTVIDTSSMKIEEKIARAYHRDLSWRKVLVRLEPDAHNNIVVRRKFANAYGWPVIKHLIDTHFSDRAVASMRDDEESSQERAKDISSPVDATGEEVNEPKQNAPHGHGESEPVEAHRFLNPEFAHRPFSEELEESDRVSPLNASSAAQSMNSSRKPALHRQDSAQWSDGDFMDSDGDSDSEIALRHPSPSPAQSPAPASPKSLAGWNWTEKIVGKGAVPHAKSQQAGPGASLITQKFVRPKSALSSPDVTVTTPTGTCTREHKSEDEGEMSLAKQRQAAEGEVDNDVLDDGLFQSASVADEAGSVGVRKTLDGDLASVGLGHSRNHADGSVVEQVARMSMGPGKGKEKQV